MTGEPVGVRADGTYEHPNAVVAEKYRQNQEYARATALDGRGRPVVESMTDSEKLNELVLTVRTISDALESFDPSSLLGGFLGGDSGSQNPNPMTTILGSLVKQG